MCSSHFSVDCLCNFRQLSLTFSRGPRRIIDTLYSVCNISKRHTKQNKNVCSWLLRANMFFERVVHDPPLRRGTPMIYEVYSTQRTGTSLRIRLKHAERWFQSDSMSVSTTGYEVLGVLHNNSSKAVAIKWEEWKSHCLQVPAYPGGQQLPGICKQQRLLGGGSHPRYSESSSPSLCRRPLPPERPPRR